MHKIKLLAGAAVLAGFSSNAAAAPEIYLGAQMGYQSTDMEYTEGGSYSFSSGNFSYSSSGSGTTNYSADGIAGGIFAGIKFYVSEGIYLSPEVNLGTSNADGGYTEGYRDSNGNSGSYSIKAEAGQSYGFGVLLGKDLTASTSIYGRLGYQRTEYELTESGTGFDTISDDETFGGIRYGIGLETAMTNNLALRLDWSLTNYSDESFSQSETFSDGFGGTETVTGSYSFDPTENLFQVGLSYRF